MKRDTEADKITRSRSKSTSKGLRGKRDGLCPSKTHESYTIPAMYHEVALTK